MEEPEYDDHKKKKKSKFGKGFKGFKKGLGKAGRSMQKGVAKAQQSAQQNIGKVPVTEEDADTVAAIQRHKLTKAEIAGINEAARELYAARKKEAKCMIKLADKLSAVDVTEGDPFAAHMKAMGAGLEELEGPWSDHVSSMKEDLVLPLEQFQDSKPFKAIHQAKLDYKNGKMESDKAAHKLSQLNAQHDAGKEVPDAKMEAAEERKEETHIELMHLEQNLKFAIGKVEECKQTMLRPAIAQFWTKHIQFADGQGRCLSKHQIALVKYQPPLLIEPTGKKGNQRKTARKSEPDPSNPLPPTLDAPPPLPAKDGDGKPPPLPAKANPFDGDGKPPPLPAGGNPFDGDGKPPPLPAKANPFDGDGKPPPLP